MSLDDIDNTKSSFSEDEILTYDISDRDVGLNAEYSAVLTSRGRRSRAVDGASKNSGIPGSNSSEDKNSAIDPIQEKPARKPRVPRNRKSAVNDLNEPVAKSSAINENGRLDEVSEKPVRKPRASRARKPDNDKVEVQSARETSTIDGGDALGLAVEKPARKPRVSRARKVDTDGAGEKPARKPRATRARKLDTDKEEVQSARETNAIEEGGAVDLAIEKSVRKPRTSRARKLESDGSPVRSVRKTRSPRTSKSKTVDCADTTSPELQAGSVVVDDIDNSTATIASSKTNKAPGKPRDALAPATAIHSESNSSEEVPLDGAAKPKSMEAPKSTVCLVASNMASTEPLVIEEAQEFKKSQNFPIVEEGHEGSIRTLVGSQGGVPQSKREYLKSSSEALLGSNLPRASVPAKPLVRPLRMRVSYAMQSSNVGSPEKPITEDISVGVDTKIVTLHSCVAVPFVSPVVFVPVDKISLLKTSRQTTCDMLAKPADENVVDELFASGLVDELNALSGSEIIDANQKNDAASGEEPHPAQQEDSELLASTSDRRNPSFQHWVSAFIDAAFNRLVPPPNDVNLGWQGDSHHAWLNQRPLRTRTLLYVFSAILVVLLFWSALARLDEVTRGNGKVIPSRQIQIIQSLDGGEVSEILVREGDIVERDQLLVKLDKTRFMANYRESEVEREALEIRQERLRALTEKRDFSPSKEILEKVPDMVAREETLFNSIKAEWDAQKSIFDSQLRQRKQELIEIRTRYEQLSRSYKLVNSEIEFSRPMVNSGAVSKVEILRLERDANRLGGERDQAYAQISRVQSTIDEAKQKISQVDLDYLNKFRIELAEVTAKVSGMNEGESGLSDRVQKADIRSPVRGTINKLHYNTLGGVVMPGKEIVEIVPLDDTLLLEARIQPQDIAFLHPGQKAVVKFTAYDYAIYGGLDGVITHIGADTVKDEEGNPYYLVKVRTDQSKIGEDKPIIPGMVAAVDIITGKKSVLMYLLKPILRGKEYALRER